MPCLGPGCQGLQWSRHHFDTSAQGICDLWIGIVEKLNVSFFKSMGFSGTPKDFQGPPKMVSGTHTIPIPPLEV